MKNLFNSLKFFFKSLFRSVEAPQVTTSIKEEIKPIVEEVQVEKMFQRKNDLVNEFVGKRPVIYSSNLNDNTPIANEDGEQTFHQYAFIDEKEIPEEAKVKSQSEVPQVKRQRYIPEPEELLHDDVDLLANKALPNREATTIARWTDSPYQGIVVDPFTAEPPKDLINDTESDSETTE